MQPIKQKSKGSKPLLLLSYEKIGPVGFEPTTKRLRVFCATTAPRAYKGFVYLIVRHIRKSYTPQAKS